MVNVTTKGQWKTYKLEDGDVVIPKYGKVRRTMKDKHAGGQFESRSLGVIVKSDVNDGALDGQDIYLTPTETQANNLDEMGDIEGSEITANAYTTAGGRSGIGVKKGGASAPAPAPSLSLGGEKPKAIKGQEFIGQVKEFKASGAKKEQIVATLVQQAGLMEHEAEALYEVA